MNAITELKRLYLIDNRQRYPNYPDNYRCFPKWSDRGSNGLTRMILDYIRLSGGFAERINNTGRPIDNRRQVVDIIGRVRTIGSMKWIPGTGTRGTADIHATINGRSVKIEVKCKATSDRLSEPQRQYQRQVAQAGGIYVIAQTFQGFYDWYQETFTPASYRAKQYDYEK